MDKERIEKLLERCISYICEIAVDSEAISDVFSRLGFTEDEKRYFDLDYSEYPEDDFEDIEAIELLKDLHAEQVEQM